MAPHAATKQRTSNIVNPLDLRIGVVGRFITRRNDALTTKAEPRRENLSTANAGTEAQSAAAPANC